MAEKLKGIYPKLLNIQQRIIGLGKDKSTYNYKYVTGDKVLSAIKPIMNELGLILKQEVLSIENTRQDYKTKNGDKSEILSKVMMRFTWVDCETGEKDENLFGANGQNDWDKGCGSAFTYAERYFLLKFFHIATDEDDIDNPDRKPEEPASDDKKKETKGKETPPTPPEPKAMTEAQKNQIIKFSSMVEIFSEEGRKAMVQWVSKPHTEEDAKRQIARYEAHIKEKLTEKQPVTA